jgi:predicted phage tail protein
MARIYGAGGGGKGGGKRRTPVTAEDSLNSKQYAQVLDLLSEGEIQGLKNGHQSIFIDNTPLQNANGTYNFQNVTVETRNGAQDQPFIPGTFDIEEEKV